MQEGQFLATVLRPPKTRALWRVLGCGMQFICGDENECKSLCITITAMKKGN